MSDYIPTGFKEFDITTGGGFASGSLAVIHGSYGKSWFVQSSLIHAARIGIGSTYLIFNKNASKEQEHIKKTIEKNLRHRYEMSRANISEEEILREKKRLSDKILVKDVKIIENEGKQVYDYIRKNNIVAIDDLNGLFENSRNAYSNPLLVLENIKKECKNKRGLAIIISRSPSIENKNVDLSNIADYLFSAEKNENEHNTEIDISLCIEKYKTEPKKISLDMKPFKI